MSLIRNIFPATLTGREERSIDLLATVQELWERPTDRAMLIIVLALALASLAIMVYAIVSDAIESSRERRHKRRKQDEAK